MANTKQEAINLLGNVNDYIGLDALNNERNVAKSTYDTNLSSLQNEYNNLLSTIANNKNTTKKDFNTGRSTVRENSFLNNRKATADLASRGVVSGGLKQLSEVGNRMETGNQFSKLANTYYNTLNELDTTEKQGTQSYNLNKEGAGNTYKSMLADIGTREANARNSYASTVAQLAEQIAARRQAASDAAAARKQAASLASAELKNEFNATLSKLAGVNPTVESYNAAAKHYMNTYGGTINDAYKYLQSRGIYVPNGASTYYSAGIKPNNKSTYNPSAGLYSIAKGKSSTSSIGGYYGK